MNKINLMITTLAISTLAVTAFGEPYIGANIGYAPSVTLIKNNLVNQNQDAIDGRLYGGYLFNKENLRFGLESGFVLPKNTGKHLKDFNQGIDRRIDAKSWGIDILGIIQYPLKNWINIAFKGGMIFQSYSVNDSATYILDGFNKSEYLSKKNKISPVAELEASFNIFHNIDLISTVRWTGNTANFQYQNKSYSEAIFKNYFSYNIGLKYIF